LQDEVSLSLALHVMTQSRKDMGDAYVEPASEAPMRKMVEELGREGKKSGKGFYDYPAADDKQGKKKLWPGLAEHFPPAAEKLSQQEMIDRMLFAQANETARCVEEGVLMKTGDGNIGSIFGWGFAPHQGGTLQFINAYGVANFVARSKELAAKYGQRFEPASILVKMAESGETFN
jgi:3-hydroxyacyl-CoA dehydrogenase/enoyl-CoA hydratase/3-hydroxybutyryl-CoA epimerase